MPFPTSKRYFLFFSSLSLSALTTLLFISAASFMRRAHKPNLKTNDTCLLVTGAAKDEPCCRCCASSQRQQHLEPGTVVNSGVRCTHRSYYKLGLCSTKCRQNGHFIIIIIRLDFCLGAMPSLRNSQPVKIPRISSSSPFSQTPSFRQVPVTFCIHGWEY